MSFVMSDVCYHLWEIVGDVVCVVCMMRCDLLWCVGVKDDCVWCVVALMDEEEASWWCCILAP